MTDLKYQPLKTFDGYYQIWFFSFYTSAKRTTTDFSLQRVGSVQNFACLMIGIIPIVDEYFGKVKDRNDIGANIWVYMLGNPDVDKNVTSGKLRLA